jgi:inorganic triphosphatase YgiF
MTNEQISAGSDDTEAPIMHQPEGKNETELKLLAPEGVFDRLREAPAIARRARNGGVASQLDATYYDTPDRVLYSHGLSLRVRHNGGEYVQTVKRGPVHGRPFARGEWETPVRSNAPDLGLLPVSEIGAPLDRLAANMVDPIFATKVRRRSQRLELPGAVVEVAFDEGSIEAGGRCEPLSEIELEVKEGDPRVLYDLGIELLDVAPLRIGTQSKADRGYELAFDLAPAAAKATAPAITVEHTVDYVIGELLGTCQHQLLANQAVAEDGRNPEGVHQMRVALRRLRTAFALLRGELGLPTLQAFNDEAKWLAKLLGAARDWDVFMTQTLRAPSDALTSDVVDFDGLRHAAEPHRAVAYASLRETLASKRYSRFQLLLRQWIETRGWRGALESESLAVLLEPSAKFASRVLTRLHGKTLKRGAHFRRLRPDARHRLRIALKKLRYAAEFFQGLYGGSAEPKGYLRCLEKLQDALGHDNDMSVTWPFLCTLAHDPTMPEIQRSIGAVMGWQARDRIEIGRALREHWRRFKTIPTFW